jgi:hypothetical protein
LITAAAATLAVTSATTASDAYTFHLIDDSSLVLTFGFTEMWVRDE